MWVRVNTPNSYAKQLRNLRSDINECVAEAQACYIYKEDIDDSYISQEEIENNPTRGIYLNDFIHISRTHAHKRKGKICSRIDIVNDNPTTEEFLKTEVGNQLISPVKNLNESETRLGNSQHNCNKKIGRKRSEATNDVRSYAQECSSNMCISRMGPMPSGSIEIVCEKSRVAMLILWSVRFPKNDRAGFNIQVTPLINCSPHDSEILIRTAKYIGTKLVKKFRCHNYKLSDYYNRTEALQLYGDLSQFILSSKTEVSTILSERMTAKISSNSGDINTKAIQKALQLSNIIPSISLDHLDIYKKVKKLEMEAIHQAEKDLSHIQKGADDTLCCPICFDTFDGEQMSLSACNHQVCASCWRGLLQSAASSGEAIIKCPYFRCSNIVGIPDVAHIMFKDLYAASDYTDILSSSQVVMNLVRFQIEQYISTSTMSTKAGNDLRFCRTPSCNRAFPSPGKVEKYSQFFNLSGSNIVICACGASMCADCKGKGLAHLGLTCSEYKKV